MDAIAQQAASAAATDFYASTARYFVSYPEDIKLYGAELQHPARHLRHRPPGRGLVPAGRAATGRRCRAALRGAVADQPGPRATTRWSPGRRATFETVIPGYLRVDSTQFQSTATKVFGPGLGADQSVLAARGGGDPRPRLPRQERAAHGGTRHVHQRQPAARRNWRRPRRQAVRGRQPLRGRDLVGLPPGGPDGLQQRHRAPGTSRPGSPGSTTCSGVSPGPGGNFIEGCDGAHAGL